MSDSVTKYFEDKEFSVPSTPTFETKLTPEEVKEAYKVLAYYDKNVILYAAKILNDEASV